MKLLHVVDELVEERGLDRETLTNIVCEGIQAAYNKKYPEAIFAVEYDRKTGEVQVYVDKKVVSAVEDDLLEITLRRARVINQELQLGDTVKVPFEGSIGRIEILRAKQIIAQQIRTIEAKALYEEFKPKEGTIVAGSIYKTELHGTIVKIGEALAFLPKSLSIPGDIATPGYTVRALLKEVLVEPRNDNQLILDRRSPEFLAELLRMEIPEIYEGLVEIKKAARIAGYKSKIIVTSRDSDVDPVGTCIGFGGARIKPILRELGTEKIDVLGEAFSVEDLVSSSLKPAVIRRVVVEGNEARVWLDADQRSLAIGKMGQNISLAAQLCGLEIKLMENVSPQGLLDVAVEKSLSSSMSDIDEAEEDSKRD